MPTNTFKCLINDPVTKKKKSFVENEKYINGKIYLLGQYDLDKM